MCTEVKLSKFSFRIHVPVITYIAKSRVFIPSVDCSHSSSCFPSARSLHQQSPAASTDGMRVTPLNTWSNTNCWVHSVHDVTTNSIPVTVTKYYRNFDTSNEFSLNNEVKKQQFLLFAIKIKVQCLFVYISCGKIFQQTHWQCAESTSRLFSVTRHKLYITLQQFKKTISSPLLLDVNIVCWVRFCTASLSLIKRCTYNSARWRC
jgi:hypothetical protein